MLDLKDLHYNNVFRKFDLRNKVVVVTGGAGILGKIYCRALSQVGATVVIADINQQQSDELVKEIKQEKKDSCVYSMAVDLSDEQSIKQWANRILKVVGDVDVIVNNAAIKTQNFFAPLEKFSVEEWNKILSVNVTGMFLVVRELGPSMIKKGKGSIINVSSIYGLVGPDNRIYEGSYYDDMGGMINTPLIYSVSKGAIIALTKYLATYWGPKGIRTNTLVPGGVESGQNDTFRKKYSEKVPLGRMAQADELVGPLLFLASDASSYVNGQNIIVDGGWTVW